MLFVIGYLKVPRAIQILVTGSLDFFFDGSFFPAMFPIYTTKANGVARTHQFDELTIINATPPRIVITMRSCNAC